MTLSARHFSFLPVCLIWLGVIAAGIVAGRLLGLDWDSMWPVTLVAAAPAVLGLILTPFMHREWAQIMVIFGWLSLAVIAVLGLSFVPMAILFMCAPAAAALFEREKVVEAMVMAAILAAVLFYAAQQGVFPESPISGVSKEWGQKMGIFATLAFLIGTLMTMANHKVGGQTVGQISSLTDDQNGTLLSATQASAPSALMVDNSPSGDEALNFDIFPGNFFLLDSQNKIMSLNQSARVAFEMEEGNGAEFGDMLDLDEDMSTHVNELIDKARNEGVEMTGKIRLRSSNGEQNYHHITVKPKKNGEIAVSVQNIIENHNDIAQLEQASEMVRKDIDEKSLFFAGVSHELRTPLNAIIGFSDMMRSRLFGPLPGKYAEYADMIHDSGQHMLDLIGDVLDLSKIGAGQYTLKYDTFQAEDIIRSSLKMVRPAADAAEVALEANITAVDDIIIEADRRAVRQILLNLLSNAIKFSPKGSLVQVHAETGAQNLRLAIIDQGAGMSPEMVEKIGQPYLSDPDNNQSTIRGTGLGLSLVKSLVELHQGQINVESQIGQGTTIRVDLPLERVSV